MIVPIGTTRLRREAMPKYKISKANGVFEIQFTTPDPDAAKRVENACKKEMGEYLPAMKPCPFCGGNKIRGIILWDRPSMKVTGAWDANISCLDCGGKICSRIDGEMSKSDAKIAIIEKWNLRAKEEE